MCILSIYELITATLLLCFQTSPSQQIVVEVFRDDPGATDPVFKVRHSIVGKTVHILNCILKLSVWANH